MVSFLLLWDFCFLWCKIWERYPKIENFTRPEGRGRGARKTTKFNDLDWTGALSALYMWRDESVFEGLKWIREHA